MPHYFSFVLNIKETLNNKSTKLGDLLKLNVTLSLVQLGGKIKGLMEKGKSFQEVWNNEVGSI